MNRLCHPNGSDVFQSLQNTRLWCEKPLTFLNSVGPCRIYVSERGLSGINRVNREKAKELAVRRKN